MELQHDLQVATYLCRTAVTEQAAAAHAASASAVAERKAESDRMWREEVRTRLQAHRAGAAHLAAERRAAEEAAAQAAVARRVLKAEEGLPRVLKRREEWELRVAAELQQVQKAADAAEKAKELRLQRIRSMV
jgi:hypothetical protein